MGPSVTMLVTRVGGVSCALPISHVVETMRPLPIEPVADTEHLSFLSGLAVVRGAPIPVIDAARLLGHDAGERGRFVVMRTTGGKRIALLVDAVIDVRAFDGAVFGELPPLLRTASHECVTAIGTLDAALLVVLDAGRVIPDEAWSRLERGTG